MQFSYTRTIWYYRQGVLSFCRIKNNFGYNTTFCSWMVCILALDATSMDAAKSSLSICVNVWSGYKFSTVSERRIARISYQHKGIFAFCFLGWTKVTLLVHFKSDSSKCKIPPSWVAQQWTQVLLRASFRLPRFSTALTQPQHSQFTSGSFCLLANQHMLEDTAQKSKTLVKAFCIPHFLSILSLSPSFYLFLFWFSNRFLGLAPLQDTRMVY